MSLNPPNSCYNKCLVISNQPTTLFLPYLGGSPDDRHRPMSPMSQAGVVMRVDNTTVLGGQGDISWPILGMEQGWRLSHFRSWWEKCDIRQEHWKGELDERGQLMRFQKGILIWHSTGFRHKGPNFPCWAWAFCASLGRWPEGGEDREQEQPLDSGRIPIDLIFAVFRAVDSIANLGRWVTGYVVFLPWFSRLTPKSPWIGWDNLESRRTPYRFYMILQYPTGAYFYTHTGNDNGFP